MSYLAEAQAKGRGSVSSAEVGEARRIPRMLAAKLLSEMSTAGLVIGTTGPGGGYRLSRPASDIPLADIVRHFEREMDEYPCPFGPGWCGNGNPCPLHEDFLRLDAVARSFLNDTTLAVFANHHGSQPAPSALKRKATPGGGTRRAR